MGFTLSYSSIIAKHSLEATTSTSFIDMTLRNSADWLTSSIVRQTFGSQPFGYHKYKIRTQLSTNISFFIHLFFFLKQKTLFTALEQTFYSRPFRYYKYYIRTQFLTYMLINIISLSKEHFSLHWYTYLRSRLK